MTIYVNTLKRIFRSKLQWISILLFPLAFMSITFFAEEQRIRISVIDEDQTRLTSDLQEMLASKFQIVAPIPKDRIEEKLLNLHIDYVIKIDRGFTDQLLKGEEPILHTFTIAESNVYQPIQQYVYQWLTDAITIAHIVNYDEEKFYERWQMVQQGGTWTLNKRNVVNEATAKARIALGYFVMAMLYTSLIATLIVIMNRNNHTMYRTLMAPVKLSRYMFELILSFFTISVLQISFVFLVLQAGFSMFAFETMVKMFILFVIFSLVTVSLGVMISSVAKNVVQAVIVGVCFVPPIAMLGGAYFPMENASNTVKSFSYFSPVKWMISAIEKILQGQALTGVILEISILFLFAFVFFSLGIVRKVDIAR